MTVYVFTGSSLTPEEGRTILDAVYLPPVAQGDVYRATLRKPIAIGIIDGLFESVPAVWHKEILWALAQGIHVFGSSSMGALRAAELEVFGMRGVGAIFEAFRSGELTDDDEVAIAHAPAELGYRPLSDAMVDIRATLVAAQAAGILAIESRAIVESIAKALFYPDRSWPRILALAGAAGVAHEQLAALRSWLPAGRVEQKHDDAVALLEHMREFLAAEVRPKQVAWVFEHTEMWDEVICQAGELHDAPTWPPENLPLGRLLDELRLTGEGYRQTLQRAMVRLLADGEARRHGMIVSSEQLQQAGDAFRRERGLLSAEAVESWLVDNHLTRDQFGRLMTEEARRRWVTELTRSEVASLLPDQLRIDGNYARLLARARAKQQALEQRGLANPGRADTDLDESALYRWYFELELDRFVPDDVPGYAHELGFASVDAFRSAVLAEWCFRHSS